jgi:hypothetical protein
MNREWELRLAAFFEELVEAELAINAIKERLAKCSVFYEEALFSAISQGASTITIKKFNQYTEERSPLT